MGTLRAALAVFSAALFLAPSALAVGGNYAFDGGTPAEQAQVRAALGASEFDFSVVTSRVIVHIVPGAWPHATPGAIWLDPALLHSGSFAWAIVQDEYAHQVDFLVFDDADRATLSAALGTSVWCHDALPGLAHGTYGCERFTSTFVWAYWPSTTNAYRPLSVHDESAAMPRARFRALVDGLLGGRHSLPQPALG
jgi:hypothetical protein